jgi:hypothetical protein
MPSKVGRWTLTNSDLGVKLQFSLKLWKESIYASINRIGNLRVLFDLAQV